MIATGFFTSWLFHKYYQQEVEQSLINTANLIHYQVSENISNGKNPDYNQLARAYTKLLNDSDRQFDKKPANMYRITFIDLDGNVLGESDPNTYYQQMENHKSRKEVADAINSGTGRDIRHSRTLGVDLLYVAVYSHSAGFITRISLPLAQLNNINRIILIYTIAGTLAGLVLTSLLALKFSSYLLKPIRKLTDISAEIARGNYSKRIEVNTQDELGRLSASFNEMASKLEATVADLKDKNMKVDSIIKSMESGIIAIDTKNIIVLINPVACNLLGIKDYDSTIGTNFFLTVRDNQIVQLIKEAMEKNISLTSEIVVGTPQEKILRINATPIKSDEEFTANAGVIVSIQDITNVKKLEQIRTEFVSNVTHELKTPLTTIRGFIETLKNGAIDDKEVAYKFLDIIDIESERLYTLINDILYLSEIETIQKDSNIGTHNLKSIVDEVFSMLENLARNKGVSIEIDVDSKIDITANRNRIKQMFINLIDNAIKYNRPNGYVFVKAQKAEGMIEITVKDTGIGIDEKHIPRIFERFYRVDKGRSRNMGGTGLGLSIVKHIVNLYNGDIRINSIPGKGTEFVIRLPAVHVNK